MALAPVLLTVIVTVVILVAFFVWAVGVKGWR